MTKKFSFITAFAMALLLLSAGAAMAQFETVGAIDGVIKDADGAALPGATVEARGRAGASPPLRTRRALPLPARAPGDYVITASLEGFKTAQSQRFTVQVGSTSTVGLSLEVGAVEETIEVLADAAQLDFIVGPGGHGHQRDDELIPRGRDFGDVVTQAGGVANEQDAAGLAVDGASGLENRFIIDGMDTTDPQSGGQAKAIVADFLEEVNVKSAGYQAEHGGAVGGVIQAVTKTGSNDFSGSVGLRYEDSSWDGDERPTLQFAPNGIDGEYQTFHKDERTRVEPHFTLGGPIVRDALGSGSAISPASRRRTAPSTSPAAAARRASDRTSTSTTSRPTSPAMPAEVLYKAAANLNLEDRACAAGQERRGSNDPANYTSGLDNENEAYSGSIDFVPSTNFFVSGRAGLWTIDVADTSVPQQPVIKQFTIGSCTVFGLPSSQCPAAGFLSAPWSACASSTSTTAPPPVSTPTGSLRRRRPPGQDGRRVRADRERRQHRLQHPNFMQFAWNTGDRIRRRPGHLRRPVGVSHHDRRQRQGQELRPVPPGLLGGAAQPHLNFGIRAEDERPDYSTGGSGDVIHFKWTRAGARVGFAWDAEQPEVQGLRQLGPVLRHHQVRPAARLVRRRQVAVPRFRPQHAGLAEHHLQPLDQRSE
jgi:hypothetical protein